MARTSFNRVALECKQIAQVIQKKKYLNRATTLYIIKIPPPSSLSPQLE